MMLTMILELFIGLFSRMEPLDADLITPFSEVLELIGEYISLGIDFLIMIMGSTAVRFLGSYLVLIVLLDSFYLAYQMIWWFIKKIPMIDIDQ